METYGIEYRRWGTCMHLHYEIIRYGSNLAKHFLLGYLITELGVRDMGLD